LPLKIPRSTSSKSFAGFRLTSTILAIYRQRRPFLFTFWGCSQKVKACPA
jgi:hypothetical protein